MSSLKCTARVSSCTARLENSWQSSWAWINQTLERAGERVARCGLGSSKKLCARRTIAHLYNHRFTPRVNSTTSVDDATLNESRKLLEQRISVYGLEEQPVEGDGNCQFRALALQLLGSQTRHATVRAVITTQLRVFGERYRAHVPDDYEIYIHTMEQDGTWGDHVTLQAAADAYHVRIMVLTSYPDPCHAFIEIMPSGREAEVGDVQGELTTVFLSFWAELHYNAMRAAKDAALTTETL